MRVCVLASGSKGNVSFVETANHKILLDMGTNLRYISSHLEALGVSLSDIDTIIISHIHTDHIGALENYIKKYHGNVYMTPGMIQELSEDSPIRSYENLVIFDDDIYLDDIRVNVIKTSHDTKDSRGYVINEGLNSVVYLTDTGYLKQKYFNILRNRTVYLFESNHDVDKLRHGKYPYHLQQRILSDEGHLSNKDSAYYLSNFIGDKTTNVILAHLSEENNTEEMAYETLIKDLKKHNKTVNKIEIARQNEITELIEI